MAIAETDRGSAWVTTEGAKDAAAAENFPVASRLLPAAVRPKVVAFYRYARAADDAADDPGALPAQRLARLAALEAGLGGQISDPANPGAALRGALGGDAAARAHAADLLRAFRRDAEGILCADWDDLMAYCAHSAMPVGRFLLAVHGEGPGARGPSDALCAALQVLNHLQDLAEDRRALGRRYLPGDWMALEGASDADLVAPAAGPALRRVIDRTLARTDALLEEAAPLPRRIRARGLRAQAAATLWLARRLHARLAQGDPLAGRVALSRADFARAGLAGLAAFARPGAPLQAAPR